MRFGEIKEEVDRILGSEMPDIDWRSLMYELMYPPRKELKFTPEGMKRFAIFAAEEYKKRIINPTK